MASLAFYGGIGEIGGNKILLRDRDTSILLDFGKSPASLDRYFGGYLQPRRSNGMLDFITMGLLPDIPGIYRDDLMFRAGRKVQAPDVDAAFFSHAHQDHINYASFLHKDIPLHMGEVTKDIVKANQERIPESVDSEILEYRLVGTTPASPRMQRTVRTFRTGDTIKIGSLDVEPIHVDHSIPGAYGFIVHTSDGPVVYTGDLRRHGTKPEMTEEFIQKAKEARPAALVMEGTRIAEPYERESEQMVYERSKAMAMRTRSLILADFNFKDADRVRTFYNVARSCGRKMVIKVKDCYLLQRLSADPVLNLPNWNDEHIAVYRPKQGSGTYSGSDYYGQDRAFAMSEHALTASQIAKHPEKYLCALGFYSFNALVDIKPAPGVLYIHSTSEPFNEEEMLNKQRLDNWVEKFGMDYRHIHCSGHATGPDLLHMAREIDAGALFPIHTEHPGAYVGATGRVVLPAFGQEYKIP